MNSPFALTFLRLFVSEDVYRQVLPAPAWRMEAEEFSSGVSRLKKQIKGYSYDREIIAHTAMLRYLAERQARVRTEIKLDPQFYDAYVGVYALNAKQVVTITREGHKIMIESPVYPRVEMFPEAENQFFVKVGTRK